MKQEITLYDRLLCLGHVNTMFDIITTGLIIVVIENTLDYNKLFWVIKGFLGNNRFFWEITGQRC